MPGGRLTADDRLRIAEWLAEGLGYAEIGRRLGRPTSTISREVARNGTDGRYLADDAQRAAGRRARRRKPARSADPTAGAGPTEAALDFMNDFASLLAATGLPRMTARVFVCLLTADTGGLRSADLVRLLTISPASVSKSVAHLEALDLVVRRPDPGTRRERYDVPHDVWGRAWRADTGAHESVAAAVQRGVDIFGAGSTAGIRLAETGRFFARLSQQMTGSPLAQPAIHDALTMVAALAHAGRPLTLGALTTALGWPRDRADAAMAAIRQQPDIADPLTVRTVAPQTYAVTARLDRLSPAQRQALDP